MVSFSEFEFGDLKWGSTKEETKDYLVKTFGINRDSMQERNNNQLRKGACNICGYKLKRSCF